MSCDPSSSSSLLNSPAPKTQLWPNHKNLPSTKSIQFLSSGSLHHFRGWLRRHSSKSCPQVVGKVLAWLRHMKTLSHCKIIGLDVIFQPSQHSNNLVSLAIGLLCHFLLIHQCLTNFVMRKTSYKKSRNLSIFDIWLQKQMSITQPLPTVTQLISERD